MIKELVGINDSLGNTMTLTKEEIWTIMGQFCAPFGI